MKTLTIAAAAALTLCAAGEIQSPPTPKPERQPTLVEQSIAKAMAPTDLEVAEAVYKEGSNSTFITRKELTNTQKRFIAAGRQMNAMGFYIHALEERIAKLEAAEAGRVKMREERLKRAQESKRKAEAEKNARKVLERAKKRKF